MRPNNTCADAARVYAQIEAKSPRDVGYRVGRSYAKDGWGNVDAACAAWLASGNSSSVAVTDHRLAAESGFCAGFVAARSRVRRSP